MAITENTVTYPCEKSFNREEPAKFRQTPEINGEELELVRRLREGDEQAFETLVRKYAPKMLAFARSFLCEEQDARDVVQNALLSVFKAIHGFAQKSQLSTWLHRIVMNRALMELRGRRRRAEATFDELLPSFDSDGKWLNVSSSFVTGDQISLERRQLHEMVRKCIAQLPESYRIILLMRDIEELDTNEVAQMLDITANAVKVRLHRARQTLRPLLMRELRAHGVPFSVKAASP